MIPAYWIASLASESCEYIMWMYVMCYVFPSMVSFIGSVLKQGQISTWVHISFEMFHYRKCINLITKIVIYSVIMLLLDELIIKVNWLVLWWIPMLRTTDISNLILYINVYLSFRYLHGNRINVLPRGVFCCGPLSIMWVQSLKRRGAKRKGARLVFLLLTVFHKYLEMDTIFTVHTLYTTTVNIILQS